MRGRGRRSLLRAGWCWWRGATALLIGCLLLAACGTQMREQPKHRTFDPSSFFEDGASARSLPANTVARGQLQLDTHFYVGMVDGAPAEEFPFPVTDVVLARGQQRYTIYCAPCHGVVGYGQGIIVQRGFTPPRSFHEERLRIAPPGYFFNVITNGFGTMYGYASRIRPEDRWAIIAYIRALQLSQNATLDDLPPEVRQQLEATPEPASSAGDE
jgi:mono/diheme cytochrome c family protein